jgi:hypothetical protein
LNDILELAISINILDAKPRLIVLIPAFGDFLILDLKVLDIGRVIFVIAIWFVFHFEYVILVFVLFFLVDHFFDHLGLELFGDL